MNSRLIAAASAVVLLASAAAAHAAEYQYSYSGTDGSFSFLDSSMPTPSGPSESGTDGFALNETGSLNGVQNASYTVIFYDSDSLGGLEVDRGVGNDIIDEVGSQLFIGADMAPAFAIQSTNLMGIDTPDTGTFTVAAAPVSAAPEPSTWLLMFAGIGGIGLMLRRAKKTMDFRFRDAFSA